MEEEDSKDLNEETSPQEKLLQDLKDTWKVAEAQGINHTEYIDTLNDITKRNRSNKLCHYFWKCFDCTWTLLLLFAVTLLLIISVPPLNNALQTHLHDKMYAIYRIMRYVFLTVHPLLLFFSIDMTQVCLVANPLVNSSMYCPCIECPHSPVVASTLSRDVLMSSAFPAVIHNGFNVTSGGIGGRETLLEYIKVYDRKPSECMQVSLGPYGPNSLDQLIHNEQWSKEREQWGYMWHDCEDIPSLSSLLPKLADIVVDDDDIEVHQHGVYSIIGLWEKSFEYKMETDSKNTTVLMILSGKVNAKIEPGLHCSQYCISPPRNIPLQEGDILVYDKRYWTYSVQSWSDISFIMMITIKTSEYSQHDKNKNEL